MKKILILLVLSLVLFFGCIELNLESEQNEQIEEQGEINLEENTTANETEEIEVEENYECSDTDGDNIYEKGIVYYGEETYYDSCENTKYVNEQICKNNKPSKIQKSCPEDYVCESGKCAEGDDECFDSDEKNYTTKGTVTYHDVEYIDFCTSNRNVKEYYCFNDEMKVIGHECKLTEKCNDGLCEHWPAYCTEGKGSVELDDHTGVKQAKKDYCKDDNTLVQYKCDGEKTVSEEVECDSGFWCDAVDGVSKCIGCEYKANGANKDSADAFMFGNEIYADKCVTTYVIEEYYCNQDNEVESIRLDCGDLKHCTTKLENIYDPELKKYISVSAAYCTK